MRLCDLAPAHIRAISPYQPGKPISELAREMGLAEESIVKLASNENPLGAGEKTREAMLKSLADIARYPDGNGFELKDALRRRYGVALDQIVLGNGSNDILELAAGAFLGPDRDAVYAQHAFAVYPLATQAAGARGIEVPARNFGHDLDAMLARVISLEIHAELARTARANLQAAGVLNAEVRHVDGARGVPVEAPFDVILLSGSLPEVPQSLLGHLKVGGRLGAIIGDAPVMRATIVTRVGESQFRTQQPWDTVAPRLLNFPEPSRFSF